MMRRKCVVFCSVCRISWANRTSLNRIFFGDGSCNVVRGCSFYRRHNQQLYVCPSVSGGDCIIISDCFWFADVSWKSPWQTSYCEGYEQTVVCLWQTVACQQERSKQWIHVTIRRCISTVADKKQIDYVPVISPIGIVTGTSRTRLFLRKKNWEVSCSPVKLPRRFEASRSPVTTPRRSVVEDATLAAALTSESSRGKTRRSGRDRRSAPNFQGGGCHNWKLFLLWIQ